MSCVVCIESDSHNKRWGEVHLFYCTCALTPILIEVICWANRDITFFHDDRRKMRCLFELVLAALLICCGSCRFCVSTMFSLLLCDFVTLLSLLLAAVTSSPKVDLLGGVGIVSLPLTSWLLYLRNRNGLRGIEKALRNFLPLSFVVGLFADWLFGFPAPLTPLVDWSFTKILLLWFSITFGRHDSSRNIFWNHCYQVHTPKTKKNNSHYTTFRWYSLELHFTRKSERLMLSSCAE